MRIVVAPGDSLWSLAERWLGAGGLWPVLARDNHIDDPDLLFAGQELHVDESRIGVARRGSGGDTGPLSLFRSTQQAMGDGRTTGTALIPANTYVFVLADEINPLSRKVVRRVLVNPAMAAEASRQLGRPLSLFPNPERYGFVANDPGASLPVGRHAMGMKPTPWISASSHPMGASRFIGRPFWIDVDKATLAGASLKETKDIVADLDRIASKSQLTVDQHRIAKIKELVVADREVVLKGPVPANAVKGPGLMGATRVLQGVQLIGFTVSAYNLAGAAETSINTGSARPLTAEAVRQVGGWASAWAGMKLGALGGAAVGITTGPGAFISAVGGGVVGGVAGYFCFDWIADHVHDN